MRHRSRIASIALIVLALAAVPSPAQPAPPWRVLLGGQDVTEAARPLAAGDLVLLEITGLASRLGLEVRPAPEELAIRDAAGRTWRGRPGASVLRAGGDRLSLAAVRAEPAALFLPPEAVAELAGLALSLDPEGRRVVFEPLPAVAAAASSVGWQPLTLAKTPEEVRETRRLSGLQPPPDAAAAARARPGAIALPPSSGTLRLSAALGWVQGADWGSELAARGSVAGVSTTFDAFLTRGEAGLRFESGRLSLVDPEAGWAVDAGDLGSDLRGLGRGVRLLWGAPERRRGFSLYLPDDRLGRREEAAVSFRGELPLGEPAALGGEIDSQGAWILRGRFHRGRLGLFGHARRDEEGLGDGHGAAAVLRLPGGVLLDASVNRSGSGPGQTDFQGASLRVPAGRFAFSLGSSRSEGARAATRVDSAGVEGPIDLPVGDLRLRLRAQRRRTEGPLLDLDQEELLVSASWAMGGWLRLDLQTGNVWLPGGETRRLSLFSFTARPARNTTLQALAVVSDALAADRFRLRLEHLLRPGLTLVAEYGNLEPYQAVTLSGDGDAEHRRVKLLLRKSWDVDTPARGGRVAGRVMDAAGDPVPGIGVRLGPYQTVTGADGGYDFPHVPKGEYELALPESSLPADRRRREEPSRLAVDRKTDDRRDLGLVPLGRVAGRVCADRDGDGRCGAGEGVAGVVLILDGAAPEPRATRSGADGGFDFANLPPGVHQVRVDAGRLPAGIRTAAPARIDLGLAPGTELDGLELRVAARARPVVLQELPGR